MTVYKATDQDMSCHMGSGRFQYALGTPMTADRSKCGCTGLHACEYVIDCMGYYSQPDARIFLAEAEGDIAEDGRDTRIACTSLTLIRELNTKEIVYEALKFMLEHPKRSGWEHTGTNCKVEKDEADSATGKIVIARGEDPRVYAGDGAWVGLIKEKDGQAQDAGIFQIGGTLPPHEWLTLDEIRRRL